MEDSATNFLLASHKWLVTSKVWNNRIVEEHGGCNVPCRKREIGADSSPVDSSYDCFVCMYMYTHQLYLLPRATICSISYFKNVWRLSEVVFVPFHCVNWSTLKSLVGAAARNVCLDSPYHEWNIKRAWWTFSVVVCHWYGKVHSCTSVYYLRGVAPCITST